MPDLEKLQKLATEPALETWEGEVAEAFLTRSRAILSEAAQTLLQIAPEGDAAKISEALARAVEQLNVADVEGGGHFIYTIEREDLCEHLGYLGLAAGLTHAQLDVALSGRDW